MKLEKLFDVNILTGVVFGLIIGAHYPMEAYKGILLVVVAAVMALKVVGGLKGVLK